mmetsp:Transcript_28629/g.32741  ORF Transcript_28629/g.32741 Transcript_28629/m.32741 type:complete len:148 (+) Transcript_28629:57-500(+)
MNTDEYVSYKSSRTVISEGVYQFIRGSIFGSIWGLITPFPAPGSAAALTHKKTGILRPLPPFSSPLSSVPSNAIMFGTILGVQRISSQTLEQIRGKDDDIWNDFISFGITYQYYKYFMGSTEKRLIYHNRFVGGATVFAVLYGAFLA